MVKAVTGGGGRGLRPVTDEAGLAEAMRRCASEASAAFGDGRVYVEQLLTRARHVEIQVIGDGTGAVAVLGDRDCSLQRHRQKLVEIAPAALSGAVRARLSEAAVVLIGSARYAGLATAEFLVQDDTIAFLEVNPRLQVEHTVTEQVTGLDLVELGLRVADGATLSTLGLDALGLDALSRGGLARGVAVQARVNTEILRPDGTLLPGGGTLSRFQPPAGRGVRVDTAGLPGLHRQPALRLAAGQGDHRRRHARGGGAPRGAGAGRVRHRGRAHQRGPAAGPPEGGAAAGAGARHARDGLGRRARRRAHRHRTAAHRTGARRTGGHRTGGHRRTRSRLRCRRVTPRCGRRWPGPWCRWRSRPASRSSPATSCSSSRR